MINNIIIKNGDIVSSIFIEVENKHIIYIGIEFNNDVNKHIIYNSNLDTNLSNGYYKYDHLNDKYLYIE